MTRLGLTLGTHIIHIHFIHTTNVHKQNDNKLWLYKEGFTLYLLSFQFDAEI